MSECDVCYKDVVNGMSPTTRNGFVLWTCEDCYDEAKEGAWNESKDELGNAPCDVCDLEISNGVTPRNSAGFVFWTCENCYDKVETLGL
jgi:hypothetical protein